MGTVVNKTTLEIFYSINTPEYPTVDWLINPDLSALSSVPNKYWKISGSTVVEMTQAEKDQVDLDNLPDYKQNRYNEIDLKTQSLIAAGFTYDSQTFSSSANAQSNWNTMHSEEAEFTWPLEISTLDSNTYSLTQANIHAFWTACKDSINGHLDSGMCFYRFFDGHTE